MHASNFCTTCGERLPRKNWRARWRGPFCENCMPRTGRTVRIRLAVAIAGIAFTSFAFGRYVRPASPPLVIQRAANSPLPDLPINLNSLRGGNPDAARNNSSSSVPSADETVYICGARTQKGTPCKRRVHAAGERCYQHKGMPAMVSLDKLTIKP